GGRLMRPSTLSAHQMLSRAFWKRLACERSAFASVSNQSAISPKPSSRAAFAMPGYMSVYSWVSPAMAALRFSRVSPIGRPVAGSPTASRYSRCPCACPVSPFAVGLLCEIEITPVGLGFPGKRILEVFLGPAAFEIHVTPLLDSV